MELNRRDTKMLQGLSVLAMLALHLFDRSYVGVFKPLLFISGVPLSYYIGQLSDFCVFGFAFCSGYGHMVQYAQHEKETNIFYYGRIKGLFSVLSCYWTVLAVFTVVSILSGNTDVMPGDFKTFLLNFFVFGSSYNGAWWYMFTYLLLVLISPILMHCIKKSPWMTAAIGTIIYCVGFYYRIHPTSYWLINRLAPFATTLFEYLIGSFFCRLRVITFLSKYWKKLGIWQPITAIILLTGMLWCRTKVVPSFFMAPATGMVILVLFHFWEKPAWVKSFFLFIGSHSTNIWLTHMFFFSVLFIGFAYWPQYPCLIYVFLLLILIPISMLLQSIERPLQRLFLKL